MVDLEVSQLTLRYAALRVVTRERLSMLAASLLEHGQRSPVLTVTEDAGHVLIDGYARVAALSRLGCDLVRALVLEVSEAEALVLAHRLESGRRRSALEEGWLVAALMEQHGLSQVEVAEQLNRSRSWVSRRLALVNTLPPSVQAAVRRGRVPAHGAMKCLVPLARANKQHCIRLVEQLREPISSRALERLYLAWRKADDVVRERIVENPHLFLKADASQQVAEADPVSPLLGDLEGIAGIARRARRRIREGLLHELDDTRLALVARALNEARSTFESLRGLLECSTATPAQPS